MAEFFNELFSFQSAIHVIRFVCLALMVLLIVYEAVTAIIKAVKKPKGQSDEQALQTTSAESVETGVTDSLKALDKTDDENLTE